MSKTKKVENFWREFCEIAGIGNETSFEVWHFGNTPEMADKLLRLVLSGEKRATTGLVWDYENEGEPLPSADSYHVITDWEGEPGAILRLTEVRVKPFNEVGTGFAFEEGEGDGSLDHWRQVHWKFFNEVCNGIGKTPELTMPVCCIRFETVYPVG